VRAFVDRLEHSGPDGEPIQAETKSSDLELARWIAAKLDRAANPT
jgi:hypothetical protein